MFAGHFTLLCIVVLGTSAPHKPEHSQAALMPASAACGPTARDCNSVVLCGTVQLQPSSDPKKCCAAFENLRIAVQYFDVGFPVSYSELTATKLEGPLHGISVTPGAQTALSCVV